MSSWMSKVRCQDRHLLPLQLQHHRPKQKSKGRPLGNLAFSMLYIYMYVYIYWVGFLKCGSFLYKLICPYAPYILAGFGRRGGAP